MQLGLGPDPRWHKFGKGCKNAVAETKASEATINQLVPALWPQLQKKIDEIPDKEQSGKHMRPQTEILEELVTQVRGLGSQMREFDPEYLDRSQKTSNRMLREFDPRMIDELLRGSMDSREGDMSLLILAGIVRDAMPWLAEVLVESHRELKNAGIEESREIAHRLMRVVKQTTRGQFGERMMNRSKAGHLLMMELPMFIDRAVSLKLNFRPDVDEIASQKSEED